MTYVRQREREFLAAWPPGPPGHESYAARLHDATPLRLEQAARAGVALATAPAAR